MSSTKSPIPFLENASVGKNNWWRYLLTSAISFGGGIVVVLMATAIFLIGYSIYLSYHGVSDVQTAVTTLLTDPFTSIILVGASYYISFVIFYIFLRFLDKKPLLSVINTVSGLRWKKLVKGLVLWMLILGILSLPDMIMNPQGYNITFNKNNFIYLLILCLLVFPIQASFEEILFRGYLMQGFSLFSKWLGRVSSYESLSKPWVPLVITSLIFGSFHFFNGTDFYMSMAIVCSTVIIGLMLGVVALGENGIETAMGIHIANNLFVSVLFNSPDSGLPGLPSVVTSQPADPFSGIPFLIFAALLAILILFWNRKEDLIRIFR